MFSEAFKSITFNALVALLFLAVVVAEDKDLSSSDVTVRALGQSGKLLITRSPRGKRADFSEKNKGQVTIELGSLKEKDKADKVVGKRINNLASQKRFNFSAVNKEAAYQGIPAVNVNLTASLENPQAQLVIIIYIFREDGNLTFGNETFAVENGTVKFFIEIKDWKFCNGSARPPVCNRNDVGENLDVEMIVKSRGQIKQFRNDTERRAKKRKVICFRKRKPCPDSYDLDSGELILPREVKIDDTFVAMASGYPKFEAKGGKNIFTFRVKKFNNTVLIDPAVNKDANEDEEVPPGGRGSGTELCFSMVIVVVAASVLHLS